MRLGVVADASASGAGTVARFPITMLVAIHDNRELAQFHPIPENDAAWGKGFTEWTNVAKSKPLFEGHYQPHLPANLGFYDLRLAASRLAQARLARQYGIEGFCYWHYWFNGQRLLEKPFNQVLASGEPDFPFCLAWANETWSRRWLGEEKEIIVKQTYSAEDDHHHIQWLMKAFSDPRYIRVNDRPLFLIYRPLDLPDPRRTTQLFRDECRHHGVTEPYLLGINSHRDIDYRQLGFDGTQDFEPQLGVLANPLSDGLKVHDYTAARKKMISRTRDFPVYPCVFVSWDNSPRRGENGIVFVNSSPEAFETCYERRCNRCCRVRTTTAWSSSMPGTSGPKVIIWNRIRNTASDIWKQCAA